MARPTTWEIIKYFTTTMVAEKLDLRRRQVRKRITNQVLPAPTYINDKGVKFFDQYWLDRALLIVRCERGFLDPTELDQELNELAADTADGETLKDE